MDVHIPVGAYGKRMVNLFVGKAFPSPVLHPPPKPRHMIKGKVIRLIPFRKGQDDEGYPALLFKFSHEGNLVGVDVVEGEGVRLAFLGIETDGDPLYGPDVIHRALLAEISQGDMAAGLVNLDWSDWRGNLLDQGQPVFPVTLIGMVNQILQAGAAQAPGIPCAHLTLFSVMLPADGICRGQRMKGMLQKPMQYPLASYALNRFACSSISA